MLECYYSGLKYKQKRNQYSLMEQVLVQNYMKRNDNFVNALIFLLHREISMKLTNILSMCVVSQFCL
jgi:hypothetical protein